MKEKSLCFIFLLSRRDKLSKRTIQSGNIRGYFFLRGRIVLLTNTCSMYYIEGITESEIIKIIERNDKIDVAPDNYMGESIVCPRCYGSGETDWVNRVVTKTHTTMLPFKKKADAQLRCFSGLFRVYIYEPNVREGFEECSYCNGTGLNILHSSKFEGFYEPPKEET